MNAEHSLKWQLRWPNPPLVAQRRVARPQIRMPSLPIVFRWIRLVCEIRRVISDAASVRSRCVFAICGDIYFSRSRGRPREGVGRAVGRLDSCAVPGKCAPRARIRTYYVGEGGDPPSRSAPVPHRRICEVSESV